MFKLRRLCFRLQATLLEETTSVNKQRTHLGAAATEHKKRNLAFCDEPPGHAEVAALRSLRLTEVLPRICESVLIATEKFS